MKIKEKEKRRRLLEKNNPDQAGRYTKAAASEKLKQLTKTGKASLLKVRMGRRAVRRLEYRADGTLGDLGV